MPPLSMLQYSANGTAVTEDPIPPPPPVLAADGVVFWPGPPPARRGFPQRLSPPITCDMAGYEGVTFVYITSRSKTDLEALGTADPWAIAGALLHSVPEWPFAGTPDPGTPGGLDLLPADLCAWVAQIGYSRALQEAAKNLTRR